MSELSRNKIFPMKWVKLIPGLLMVLVFLSCNHHRNHPGWAYMPDMYYSEPFDAFTENPVFSDSVTMQNPVTGSISRGHMPYPYQPGSMDDQILAGTELENPLEVSEKVLAEGAEQYTIHCAICHGDNGDGQGYLYTSGKYTVKPTVLNDNYVANKPDGEIYHVITMGSVSGLMGAYGAQVNPMARWKIIHYMRQFTDKSKSQEQ